MEKKKPEILRVHFDGTFFSNLLCFLSSFCDPVFPHLLINLSGLLYKYDRGLHIIWVSVWELITPWPSCVSA